MLNPGVPGAGLVATHRRISIHGHRSVQGPAEQDQAPSHFQLPAIQPGKGGFAACTRPPLNPFAPP